MAADTDNMEQTLVAATLVAASLAVLFVVWQAEVSAALALKPSQTGRNNENDTVARRTARGVLFYRSFPLLTTSGCTLFVLVHQLRHILCEAWQCFSADCSLDDVKALAVLNAVVVGLLTLGLLRQFIDLWRKWRSLGGLKSQNPRPAHTPSPPESGGTPGG